MKFNGTSWEYVGTAISPGWALYTSLAFDSSNVPYVAYSDWGGANGYKASVMKFDGSNWTQVGTRGFSAGAPNGIILAINSSNIPYVAYLDGFHAGKASVMKFDGSSWVQVGAAGFSAGTPNAISLAFDSGDVPYVAYNNGNNGYKASVVKFGGSSWVQVGADFSNGSAQNISLALDSNGISYVAYRDGYNGGKASVMRYDCGACGCGRDLPANTWLMTAPACQPAPPDINSQYGDDLGGTYGSTWIAYGWEANAYTPQADIAPLVPGFGSWLYSTGAGTLDISGTATPTEDCSAYGWPGQQCFAIDLVVPPAGQGRWNLVGHPFPYTVSWADVRVSSSVNGSSWTLRTPSEADASVMRKTFHRWTGSAYEPKDDATPGSIGILQPQEAVWIRTLASDPAVTKIKLLIPAQ